MAKDSLLNLDSGYMDTCPISVDLCVFQLCHTFCKY